MKLLFCKKCEDLFTLRRFFARSCQCGATKGQYTNLTDAWYEGEHAIPVGFVNADFARAVRNRPASGSGERFEAFVIPIECPTMKRTK